MEASSLPIAATDDIFLRDVNKKLTTLYHLSSDVFPSLKTIQNFQRYIQTLVNVFKC